MIQERQEEQDGHVTKHAKEIAEICREEGPLEDDVPWSKGVGSDADLDQYKDGEQGRRDGQRRDGLRLAPAFVAAVVEAEQEAEHGRDEEEGAEEVDPGELLPPVGVVPLWEVKHTVDGDEGYDDDGHLPYERPVESRVSL